MYNLLRGVRVLDLTSVVLGPIATQYLGDFGADVIKVEPPSGDIFRYVKPSRSEDMGAGFLNMNRNKRSVCLNLKDKKDKDCFLSLLKDADVLVHNMRLSAAERLDLGPEQLKQSNPELVYCHTPGYGSRGRNADKPAYDDIIQAASGIAALNSGTQGEPRFIPTIVCDKVGGMHLAMAMLAGIAHQAKTGKGCVIEAPMFEGTVAFLLAEQLAGETFIPAIGTVGYERLLSPNRRPYKTKDSYIAVMPYNGEDWLRVLKYIESDLATESWVQSSVERSARVDELYATLSDAMVTHTTSEWLKIFKELDIPCTRVYSMLDLLENEHLQDVGFFSESQHPTEGSIRSAHSPFWVADVEEHPDKPAPGRSDNTKKIKWHARQN